MIHIFLHFFIPLIVAYFFYKKALLKSWIIMGSTMLVDLDHLMANPIFDPNRCSIGFHPLHSYYAIGIYFILVFFPKVRLIGIGLIIHMILDYLDCFI